MVVCQMAAIAHIVIEPIAVSAMELQRVVGDHIQMLPARQGESERKLWAFVSSFTENKMDGDKLSKLYAKLKANKAAPSGKHWNRWEMNAAVHLALNWLNTPGQPGLVLGFSTT